jgi:hypothetical protein
VEIDNWITIVLDGSLHPKHAGRFCRQAVQRAGRTDAHRGALRRTNSPLNASWTSSQGPLGRILTGSSACCWIRIERQKQIARHHKITTKSRVVRLRAILMKQPASRIGMIDSTQIVGAA